jgi:cation diffusion facilitator family transporter
VTVSRGDDHHHGESPRGRVGSSAHAHDEHAHDDQVHDDHGRNDHGHHDQGPNEHAHHDDHVHLSEHDHDTEHRHDHDDDDDHHAHEQNEHEQADHTHTHAHGRFAWLEHLLQPHSHDAADSVDQALAGSADGIRAVKLSLLGLGVTAALQLAVAMASGSVAVLADTIHNFADASTAIPLWLAFWVGRRPPTPRYTYGYGRAEDLAGVFVVAMIIGSAAVAFWESLQKLLNPTPIDHLGWVAGAGVAGLIGNELVAQYRIRVGHRIGSAALVADGYHARTDGLTSLAVLIGAAGVWLGFALADPIVGLAITAAILVVLKDATVQMWRRLMDAVDPGLVEQARTAAARAEGVQRVETVRARWIGHTIHAEALIVADADLTLSQAHEVAERARHNMLHAVPKLTSVTVHVDPCAHAGIDHHAALAHHDEARAR